MAIYGEIWHQGFTDAGLGKKRQYKELWPNPTGMEWADYNRGYTYYLKKKKYRNPTPPPAEVEEDIEFIIKRERPIVRKRSRGVLINNINCIQLVIEHEYVNSYNTVEEACRAYNIIMCCVYGNAAELNPIEGMSNEDVIDLALIESEQLRTLRGHHG